MKNATHNRIGRLLPLVILVSLAFTASTVSAGVNVWTTNGPEGGDILALAVDPSSAATPLRRHRGLSRRLQEHQRREELEAHQHRSDRPRLSNSPDCPCPGH